MPEPMPVLLTGASGFIAKHVLLRLLNAGHRVTASLRSPDRQAEVRAAIGPHLTYPAAQDRLRFVTLDLGRDEGWNTAFEGTRALIHTASPFPLAQPKDEDQLIRPAVDGTLRALRAAAAGGVTRVVLTSSVAAVSAKDPEPGKLVMDEDDWTDLDHPSATAYVKSKTLAERAAWEFVAGTETAGGDKIVLTTINPALVLGPPLDRHFGSSVSVVQRALSGRDPMLPRIGFGVVDVRDVAEMHLRALQRPASGGKRFIAVDRFLWFKDISDILVQAYPGRRIARRIAPDILIRALALFDPSLRSVLPYLGRRDTLSNARARAQLGIDFIDAADALRATASFLMESGAMA